MFTAFPFRSFLLCCCIFCYVEFQHLSSNLCINCSFKQSNTQFMSKQIELLFKDFLKMSFRLFCISIATMRYFFLPLSIGSICLLFYLSSIFAPLLNTNIFLARHSTSLFCCFIQTSMRQEWYLEKCVILLNEKYFVFLDHEMSLCISFSDKIY